MYFIIIPFLPGLGFTTRINFLTGTPEDVAKTLNCVHNLIQRLQHEQLLRDDAHVEQRRLHGELQEAEATLHRLKKEIEVKERDIGTLKIKSRQMHSVHQEELELLVRDRENLQKECTALNHRQIQFQHEIRRKELQYEWLQEKLRRYLADRKRESETSMEIVGRFRKHQPPQKEKNRITSKLDELKPTSSKGGRQPKLDESMVKMIVTAYEEKQKELLAENNDLQTALNNVRKEYAQIMNTPHEGPTTSIKTFTNDSNNAKVFVTNNEKTEQSNPTLSASNDESGQLVGPQGAQSELVRWLEAGEVGLRRNLSELSSLDGAPSPTQSDIPPLPLPPSQSSISSILSPSKSLLATVNEEPTDLEDTARSEDSKKNEPKENEPKISGREVSMRTIEEALIASDANSSPVEASAIEPQKQEDEFLFSSPVQNQEVEEKPKLEKSVSQESRTSMKSSPFESMDGSELSQTSSRPSWPPPPVAANPQNSPSPPRRRKPLKLPDSSSMRPVPNVAHLSEEQLRKELRIRAVDVAESVGALKAACTSMKPQDMKTVMERRLHMEFTMAANLAEQQEAVVNLAVAGLEKAKRLGPIADTEWGIAAQSVSNSVDKSEDLVTQMSTVLAKEGSTDKALISDLIHQFQTQLQDIRTEIQGAKSRILEKTASVSDKPLSVESAELLDKNILSLRDRVDALSKERQILTESRGTLEDPQSEVQPTPPPPRRTWGAANTNSQKSKASTNSTPDADYSDDEETKRTHLGDILKSKETPSIAD